MEFIRVIRVIRGRLPELHRRRIHLGLRREFFATRWFPPT